MGTATSTDIQNVPKPRTLSKEGVLYTVKTHDDRVWFFIGYFILGFVLSYYLNLGFFLLLSVLHFVLDVTKHRLLGDSWRESLQHGLRESLVDAAFFFVGFVLGLYVHVAVTVGIAGAGRALAFTRAARVGRAARLGQAAARSTTASRTVETFSKIYLKKNTHLIQIDGKLTLAEKIFSTLLILCWFLLLLSPLLIDVTPEILLDYMNAQLIPRF
ncbi:MAG: hypothetical protein KC925_02905 [Candidatus Doudnabacteria bacterium]|nr:hypothetical protein [Candidatus Doudnabacteria bacterium]